ncbi:MAG: hypothetical protein CUN55_18000, partial [Phototrophicales bacterium]
HNINDYVDLMDRLVKRLDGERFGVILIEEPHRHEHDSDDHETTFIDLINQFRRKYRVLSREKMFGFARVLPADLMEQYIKTQEIGWPQVQEAVERYARYVWGTRGRIFTEVESAQKWLHEQAELPPLDLGDELIQEISTNQRVGLFYGSSSGVTEEIATEIQKAWLNISGGSIQ